MRVLIIAIVLLFAASASAQDITKLTGQQLELVNQQLTGQLSYIQGLIDKLYRDKIAIENQRQQVIDQYKTKLQPVETKPAAPEAQD